MCGKELFKNNFFGSLFSLGGYSGIQSGLGKG